MPYSWKVGVKPCIGNQRNFYSFMGRWKAKAVVSNPFLVTKKKRGNKQDHLTSYQSIAERPRHYLSSRGCLTITDWVFSQENTSRFTEECRTFYHDYGMRAQSRKKTTSEALPTPYNVRTQVLAPHKSPRAIETLTNFTLYTLSASNFCK